MNAPVPPNHAPDFVQVPLGQVFRSLEKQYGVSIVFDNCGCSPVVFTGKFSDKESIASILNTIAALNGLTVTPAGSGFEINK